MDYLTKIQAIRRKKGISQCYVNLPLPLAAAIDIEPGEMVEWKVDTRYKLWLIRQRPKPKKPKSHEGFQQNLLLSLISMSPSGLIRPVLCLTSKSGATRKSFTRDFSARLH